MKRIVLFLFSLLFFTSSFSQPIAKVFRSDNEKEIILEKYTSRLWLKTADKKRHSGYLLEFTGEEFILLDFSGADFGTADKKRKMRAIDTAGNMDERTKHIEMLKLYYTDTVRIPLMEVKLLEAEKPFYKEHRKLVPVLGITGAALLITSGLLTKAKIEGAEDPLTISASVGAAMIITAGIINRHYHIHFKSGKWKVEKLRG